MGALTSKPYSYRARPWEIKNKTIISVNDPSLPVIKLSTVNDKTIRVLPVVGNEEWISNHVRFSEFFTTNKTPVYVPLTIKSIFKINNIVIQEIDNNHNKNAMKKILLLTVLEIERKGFMSLSISSISDINKYSTIRFLDNLSKVIANRKRSNRLLKSLIDIGDFDEEGFVNSNVFEEYTIFLLFNFENSIPVIHLSLNSFLDNDGELYSLTLSEKQYDDMVSLGISKKTVIKIRNGFVKMAKPALFLDDNFFNE